MVFKALIESDRTASGVISRSRSNVGGGAGVADVARGRGVLLAAAAVPRRFEDERAGREARGGVGGVLFG